MTTRGKKKSIEEELARLSELGRGPLDDAAGQELTRTIERGSSLVVARAARIVKDRTLPGYHKTLDAAFRRFLDNPVKTDPGCNAKLACLEALDATDTTDPEPFQIATRHVQKEGAWGPPVDTAVHIRARSVRALAHMGHVDLFLYAGELLGDPEPPVRQAAAEALAHSGDRNGAGLLLLAAARVDEDPVILTSYYSALLELAADFGLPRLRALLRGSSADLRELAAIALGQSGLEPAATALVEAMEATPLAAERVVCIRALGLHRTDRALGVLCDLVTDGPPADAEAAVKSLAARRFDKGVREKVAALVAARGSLRLSQAFDEAFADDAD